MNSFPTRFKSVCTRLLKYFLLYFLLLFQLCLLPDRESYLSFDRLEWYGNCDFDVLPASYQIRGNHAGGRRCKTRWKPLRGNILSIDYAGAGKNRKHHPVYLALQYRTERENGQLHTETVYRLPPPSDTDAPREAWKEARLSIPAGGAYRFVVLDAAQDSWIALRERVNFYSSRPYSIPPYKSIQCALAFVISAFTFFALPRGPMALFLSFISIGVGVHFRFGPDFNLDDWLLLDIIHTRPGALLETFNAHFIPLFIGVFRLQTLLFGDIYSFYLLTSIAVLALGATALYQLLRVVIPSSRPVAAFCATLYLVNSLHIDSMQWLICQAVIWSATFMFLGLLFCCSEKYPRLGVLCLGASALFFGEGLIAFPVLCCLLYLKRGSLRTVFHKDRSILRAAFGAFVLVCIGYLVFQSGEGHEARGAVTQATVERFFDFVFYSSHFTTVMGGLGLGVFDSPALIPPSYFDWLQYYIPPSSLRYAPMTGVILLLVTQLAIISAVKNRPQTIRIILIGELLILLPLMLVGLGRSHFPLHQAQAFRYQAFPLLGLLLLLAPALELFKRQRVLLTLLLSLLIVRHLDTHLNFTSYAQNGIQMRRFLVQLEQWMPMVEGTTYEGDDSAYQGLFPIRHANPRQFRTAVPTVLHPKDLYQYLQKLKGTGA